MQLESRIFHFLDAELGTRRTPFEATNYNKLISSLALTGLIANHYTDILKSKASRFLDKKDCTKEKFQIKATFKENNTIVLPGMKLAMFPSVDSSSCPSDV